MDIITKKPKAVFLDLDDTISSYDSVCDPAWQKCCEDFAAKHQPAFTWEELLESINHTRSWYWADPARHKKGRENLIAGRRDVVRYALAALEITDEDKVVELADHYTQLQDSLLALLPGSLKALKMLKDMGIRMAVITNGGSDIQRGKLKRFGITDFFEQVFIDSEVGFSKPDKRIFQYALDTMKLTPGDVWMVGDNLVWDIWGPKQLGIFTVWNDYKNKGLPEDSEIRPELTVGSILEMAEIIDRIQ